ncbi:hypothetical protein [Bdellovibrio sp. HCB2-146]|uniref:hypothetical protein n=1 Tax=Bdellovibrio sp. HCB2-146 TaxID=3394362 RepID=UPI0039BC3282
MILFLALSFGLHILVGLFLFLKRSEPEIPEQTIEFEVLPEQPAVAQKGQEGRMGPKGKTRGTKPGTQKTAEATPEDILRDGGKVNLDKAGTSVAGETIFGEGSTGSKGSGAWVEQIGIEKGIELTAFLQRIQERIDRGLDYPEDMAVQRIRGDVRVDLYVDRKGRIQGDFHLIRGPETLLNLYVTSALLVLLKEPLPENLWAKEDKIPITIHVKFSTYEFAETKMQNDNFFQANELNFVRARYVKPLAVAKVEKSSLPGTFRRSSRCQAGFTSTSSCSLNTSKTSTHLIPTTSAKSVCNSDANTWKSQRKRNASNFNRYLLTLLVPFRYESKQVPIRLLLGMCNLKDLLRSV